MKVLRTFCWIALALLLAAAAAGLWVYHHRPGLADYERWLVPVAASTPEPTPDGAGPLQATWFGTTAVLLSDGHHAVMIDPFFTRPPGLASLILNREIAPDEARIRGALQAAGVTRLEAVLVSHSHYDHAMDAGVVARLTGAALLGSASTAQIGRGAGLPEARLVVAQPGVTTQHGPFRITFIRSVHAGATGGHPTGEIEAPLVPPARYLDYKQGGTYSILVEHPRGRVLHHGSAGFVPGALRGRQADVVFLGVALLDDLGPYLAEVVDAVGARRVIPTHWDDFTRSLDEPPTPMPVAVHLDRFFAQMAQTRPDLAIETLRVAQPVDLFPR